MKYIITARSFDYKKDNVGKKGVDVDIGVILVTKDSESSKSSEIILVEKKSVNLENQSVEEDEDDISSKKPEWKNEFSVELKDLDTNKEYYAVLTINEIKLPPSCEIEKLNIDRLERGEDKLAWIENRYSAVKGPFSPGNLMEILMLRLKLKSKDLINSDDENIKSRTNKLLEEIENQINGYGYKDKTECLESNPTLFDGIFVKFECSECQESKRLLLIR